MPATAPKTTFNSALWWIGGVTLSILIAFALALPSLVSSSWGKESFLKLAGGYLNGRIKVEELSIGWFSGQKAQGISVYSVDNKPILKLDTLETQSSLLPLLLGHLSGESRVRGLSLEVIPYADGTTNIDYLLKRRSSPSSAQELSTIYLEGVEAHGSTLPSLNLHLTGKSLVNERQGTFKLDVATLQDSDSLKIDADLTQFPVLVLDQIVALKNPQLQGILLQLLGDSLDVNVSQTLEKNGSHDVLALDKLFLKIASEKTHINVESQPKNEQGKAPLDLNAKMLNSVVLTVPGIGKVELSQATLRSEVLELADARVHLQAKLKIVSPEAALRPYAKEPFTLEMFANVRTGGSKATGVDDIVFQLKSNQVAIAVEGKLTSDHHFVMTAPATVHFLYENLELKLAVAPQEFSLAQPQLDQLQAKLYASGSDEELISFEWNPRARTLAAKGSFENFPIGRVSPELGALFGEKVTGSLFADVQPEENGPVRLSLQGSDGGFFLDGHYKKGFLFLNKPLEGQFLANRQFASLFLKKIPLLSSLISADNPIAFNIDQKDFALPLHPFTLDRVTVGQATFHFGNMQFRNQGPLAKALSPLNLGKNALLSLWFTPLYVALDKGTLTIERVDFLLQNSYPLAAWGHIDLPSQSINMQVGLSSMTIARAFNAQIGNPRTYIAVPLRGSLNDPSFDKKSAAAQITSLVAKNQAGVPGAILSSVLQIASNTPKADIPPPTTTPFPWEGQLQASDSDQEPSASVNIPIKAVSDGAGKLLKSLFR